jgi:dTDP-4-dehydrorhamnose 3,5-epimerase
MIEDMILRTNGDIATDDRGIIRFVNDFHFENVKRFYQVENHEAGFIRAWHGHKKEGKYVYVAKGSILLGIISMEENRDERFILTQRTNERYRIVLTAGKPQILFIPPGCYNGFKTLQPDTIVFFFSTLTMEEAQGDDYRLKYDEFNDIFKFDTEYR